MKTYNIRPILLTFVVLNILDLISTIYLTQIYGIDVEQAPLAKHALELFGIVGLLLIKVIPIGCIVAIIINYKPYVMIRAIFFCNFIFTGIVINNLGWIYLSHNPILTLIYS